MLFVFSSLGIGIASPLNSDLSAVLYLTPLVVLIFDLQILGEDFAVKRSGVFIARCPNSPQAEKNWESRVRNNRDAFSTYAELLGSSAVLIAAAAVLWDSSRYTFFYWFWLFLNFCVVVFIWFFGKRKVYQLKKIETSLSEVYPHQASDE